uniref:Uncharacterized protein n=1 Tax=Zea mays TaxID=4577 RepID=C4J1G9_MAIZE|nr:unknown [Zea mays]
MNRKYLYNADNDTGTSQAHTSPACSYYRHEHDVARTLPPGRRPCISSVGWQRRVAWAWRGSGDGGRLLDVLERAEPHLLVQHRASCCSRIRGGSVSGDAQLVGVHRRRAEHAGLGVGAPVLVGAPRAADHIVRHERRAHLLLRVLVVRRGVHGPPALRNETRDAMQ